MKIIAKHAHLMTLVTAACIQIPALAKNEIGLVEISTVPFDTITGANNMRAQGLGEADRLDKYNFNQKQYGFIRGGSSVYFGEGCQELVIRTRKISCKLPRELKDVFIPPNGASLFGTIDSNQSILIAFHNDGQHSITNTNNSFQGKHFLDPTGQYSADDGDYGFAPTQIYKTLHVTNLRSGKRLIHKIKGGAYSFIGFSGNGQYALTESAAIDVKSGKNIPVRHPVNYDLTLVYKNTTNKTTLYSNQIKSVLWKVNEDLGNAIAFSWNSNYIATSKGYILDAKSGKIVADGLYGSIGAVFSPDGRSLVTTDNLAFYVYQLADTAPPLFGEYPGPTYTPRF